MLILIRSKAQTDFIVRKTSLLTSIWISIGSNIWYTYVLVDAICMQLGSSVAKYLILDITFEPQGIWT